MNNVINNLSEIASLYDEFYLLDEVSENRPKESKKNKNPLIFLGSENAPILFIIKAASAHQEADKQMIENLILRAMKKTWDEVMVVYLDQNQEYTISEIMESAKAGDCIAWGCSDGLGFSHIYESKTLGKLQVLNVHPLEVYHNNPEEKKPLWDAIRLLLKL